jgi:hypothetical protein
MKTIEKTINEVTIELTQEEFLIKGFDKVWDEVRAVYPEKTYAVKSIYETNLGQILIIKLTREEKRGRKKSKL